MKLVVIVEEGVEIDDGVELVVIVEEGVEIDDGVECILVSENEVVVDDGVECILMSENEVVGGGVKIDDDVEIGVMLVFSSSMDGGVGVVCVVEEIVEDDSGDDKVEVLIVFLFFISISGEGGRWPVEDLVIVLILEI